MVVPARSLRWAVLNAIFACPGRGLPLAIVARRLSREASGVHQITATGARVGTWMRIHDRLREWTRIEQDRQPSPSEAIVDSQSVKSAAGVSKQMGFDSGKVIKGRKRFLSVDTLGLVLRVFVTAASVPEREGGVPSAQAGQTHGQSRFSLNDYLG